MNAKPDVTLVLHVPHQHPMLVIRIENLDVIHKVPRGMRIIPDSLVNLAASQM